MFFTAIHQMMTESVDLTIVIRKANGQLTVSTLPKSNGLKDEAQNHIVPLTVTGTPQELDTGFLQAVTRPIQKACGLISNMAQFEAQADKHGTVRGSGGQGRRQQQGRQGSEIQGNEGRTRETGKVRETDEEGGRTDSRQESPGSRQRAYAGKSTRECRPTERNRRKNKDCHFRNEQG